MFAYEHQCKYFLPVCAAEIATLCCYQQHYDLWREVDLVNMADLSQLTWTAHQQITTEHHYSAATLSTGGKCVGKLDKHISIISAFCKYCFHCATFAGRVLSWRAWCMSPSIKRHGVFEKDSLKWEHELCIHLFCVHLWLLTSAITLK